jgi:hypothetical protein
MVNVILEHDSSSLMTVKEKTYGQWAWPRAQGRLAFSREGDKRV